MPGTLICGLAALAAVATSGTAFGCGAGRVAFADTFDALNAKVWGPSDKWMSAAGGRLVLSDADGDFYAADAEPLFRNVDYCALAILTATSDVTAAYAGLTFWMRNAKDFYTFQITLDGYADVYRYDGDWTALIDDRPFASIKQGVGAVNELRVVTHGNTAAFYVNGVKFDAITDKRPPGTSRVGVMIDTPPSGGSATFAFDSVEVRDPQLN